MEQIKRLQENMFTQIAKLIASSLVKMKLDKAMRELSDDPNIQSSIQSMKYHAEAAQRALERICKDHPEHDGCKQRGKSK